MGLAKLGLTSWYTIGLAPHYQLMIRVKLRAAKKTALLMGLID